MFLGPFRAYVGQPHNYIGWAISMHFASINYTNPRTNPWYFWKKKSRIGDFDKFPFFFVGHFGIFFSENKGFILMLKGQSSFLASKVGLKFWCLPWFPAVFYPGQTFCTQVHVVFERHLVNIHSLVVWKKIFLPEHFLCSDTFRDAGKFSKFSINLQKLRRDVCCVKNSASIVIWNINSITY